MKNLKSFILATGVAIAMLSACETNKQPVLTASNLDPAKFDTVINGDTVKLFVLKNANGMEACITNYGGRVVSLMVPDKDGNLTDVVLGYDNIAQYADTLNSPSDYGSSVGRYANRINDGKITVAGQQYQLTQNDTGNGAKHCLHGGGNTGWMHKVYQANQVDEKTLRLSLVSPDGDNGFPGTVTAVTTYKLTDDNVLDITFEATTDKETIINMTNHNYYNLNGDLSQEGMDMVLYINADNFTPSDASYMTTGEIKSVEGTPMDFRTPSVIAEKMDTSYIYVKNATGFDHNWCLNTFKDGKGDDSQVCASLYSPKTGILLEMFTNEPGVQVYTGNFQGTGIACKHGVKYPKHVSVCLESQKYPDSPNKKDWVQPTLKPGEQYYSHAAYRFSVKEDKKAE
ncbi:MAG: galactose mutarotase [Prevotella sp.]|nr:galactose mutarotase [Prevotella sp.]